jgi:hypothetical protein
VLGAQSNGAHRVRQIVRDDGQELVAHHRGALGEIACGDGVLVEQGAVQGERALVRQRGQERTLVLVEEPFVGERQRQRADDLAARDERKAGRPAPAVRFEHVPKRRVVGAELGQVAEPQCPLIAHHVADGNRRVDGEALAPASRFEPSARARDRLDAPQVVLRRAIDLADNLDLAAPPTTRASRPEAAPTAVKPAESTTVATSPTSTAPLNAAATACRRLVRSAARASSR